MKKSIFESVLLLWLLLTSCAIPGADDAPRERQEIRVTGTDSIFIRLRLRDEMLKLGLGYGVGEQSGDSITFERKLYDDTEPTEYAAHHDMLRPSSRVTYRFIQQNGTVRVVADLKIIENPGSHTERVTGTMQHPDSTLIQEVLRRTKWSLENQGRNGPQDKKGDISPTQWKQDFRVK